MWRVACNEQVWTWCVCAWLCVCTSDLHTISMPHGIIQFILGSATTAQKRPEQSRVTENDRGRHSHQPIRNEITTKQQMKERSEQKKNKNTDNMKQYRERKSCNACAVCGRQSKCVCVCVCRLYYHTISGYMHKAHSQLTRTHARVYCRGNALHSRLLVHRHHR